MKKVYITFVAIFLAAASVTAILSARSQNSMDDFFRANVEALSASEGLDTSYARQQSRCTIYVGIDGKIQLKSGTILKADSNGYISFDGLVICSSGGNTACSPVECYQLYSLIF